MTKTYLTGDITPSQRLTFYSKHGDILPFGSLTITVIFLILALVKRFYERKKDRFKVKSL